MTRMRKVSRRAIKVITRKQTQWVVVYCWVSETPVHETLHSPQRETICNKWQHLFRELSPVGAIQSRLPKSKCTVHINSFNNSIPSKAIPKESHEMQPFTILLKHRSDYCLLWEELETVQSSTHSWTWFCRSLLLSIKSLSWSEQLFLGKWPPCKKENVNEIWKGN